MRTRAYARAHVIYTRSNRPVSIVLYFKIFYVSAKPSACHDFGLYKYDGNISTFSKTCMSACLVDVCVCARATKSLK